MIQVLALERVTVVSSRAEEAAHQPEYRQQFDAVVTRGLAKMDTLAELTLPFCRKGGYLIAQKKGDNDEEMRSSANAINTLGGGSAKFKSVEIPEFTDKRCLVIVPKVADTPARFPRRPGIPAKRPLA